MDNSNDEGKSDTRHLLPPWLRDAFNALEAECENQRHGWASTPIFESISPRPVGHPTYFLLLGNQITMTDLHSLCGTLKFFTGILRVLRVARPCTGM